MNAVFPGNTDAVRDEIIQALNLGHLAPHEQDEIIDGIGEVLFEKVFLKLYDLVPDSEKARFTELSKEKQGDALQEFLRQHVPTADAVVAQELHEGLETYKRTLADVVAGK